MVPVGILGLKSSDALGKCLPKHFGNVAWFFPGAFIPTAALVISLSVDGEQKLGEFVQDSGYCLEKGPKKPVETVCCLQIKSTRADKGFCNLSLYNPNDTEAIASPHSLFQYLIVFQEESIFPESSLHLFCCHLT